MKILTAAQTRLADQATLREEGIPSEALMERAATAFVNWLTDRFSPEEAGEILLLCGPGNNGGDGLAAARLLYERDYRVRVDLLPAEKHSADFEVNRQRIPPKIPVNQIDTQTAINPGTLVIDALFGTGLSRPLAGAAAAAVEYLNAAQARVVALDMPSGLFADAAQAPDCSIVRARHTVGFELPKLAYLLPQNAGFVGEWHVASIGLSARFIAETAVDLHFTDTALLAGRLPRRQRFSHKGTYGHALLLAGSHGKMGAAVLATNACLRSGVGLLTVRVPAVGYDILQISAPEAMALTDPAANFITELPDLKSYSAVGIGPGLGQAAPTKVLLASLLHEAKIPLIIDADALNLLGENRDLLAQLPPDTILTPHPKEFERLTEPARDDYHRLELLLDFCRQRRCYTVLKGAYTCLGTPEGTLYFNSTGNPGMATGGSGDVLTGVITSLRAQHLSALNASLIGIYAHGRAGDLAARETGEAGLVAGDIITKLGPALRELESVEV